MAEVLVCKDGEIADGGVRVITAGEVEIGVIRHGGKYYAYRNHCPHQGGPVCEGVRMPQVLDVIAPDRTFLGQDYNRNDMHIVCPWHGYEFNIRTGCHQGSSRFRLRKADFSIREGEIYVRT